MDTKQKTENTQKVYSLDGLKEMALTNEIVDGVYPFVAAIVYTYESGLKSKDEIEALTSIKMITINAYIKRFENNKTLSFTPRISKSIEDVYNLVAGELFHRPSIQKECVSKRKRKSAAKENRCLDLHHADEDVVVKEQTNTTDESDSIEKIENSRNEDSGLHENIDISDEVQNEVPKNKGEHILDNNPLDLDEVGNSEFHEIVFEMISKRKTSNVRRLSSSGHDEKEVLSNIVSQEMKIEKMLICIIKDS